ncbi:MAG: sulfurtransferase complex subunit TusB [Pseudomonadota bacterium]
MILHTVSASPASAAFLNCLRLVTADDGLLLLEDGVYALCDTAVLNTLAKTGVQLYALADHALAAGIGDKHEANVQIIDMQQFVALTERFPRQLAWY